ncbi:MAG: nickel pincer cofactor biosynthesis protein LarC [Gemmatimonadota bacterium]
MKGLIFDPFAGISGDMTLGALVDLGLEPAWLRAFAGSLRLGPVDVVIERVMRRGIAAHAVRFDLPPEDAHRHLRHIVEIVEATGAPAAVRERATAAFRRIAAAEAEVHGTTLERVHFHEVGARDAILDVLCAMAGVAELGFEAFYTRPVSVGRGFVDIAHGRYPLPAPATLRILEGLSLRDPGFDGECTTPTGAAILATLTGGAEPPMEVRPLRSGFGAGSRDPADRPNCLRLVACEVPGERGEALYLVQADVDDLAPEYAPAALDALLAAGALDAVLLPVAMKKGRAGQRVEALAPASRLQEVLEAALSATPTLGVRYWPVQRPALPRREEEVTWRGHRIRLKVVALPGGGTRAKPEFEDVAAAGRALGMAPHAVRQALERELPHFRDGSV